jgi:quinohemoprotein ethanol dehydrogenase
LPPTPVPAFANPVDGPDMHVDEVLAKEGATLFAKCQWCHGAGAIAGGGGPDLRASLSPLVATSFNSVVRGGVEVRGMPKFEELTDRELEALRHYIRARARKVTRPDGIAPPPPPAPEPATPDAPAEEPPEPRQAPGSLEPEAPPPGS